VALFVRRDEFGRFVSCLVFLPRDRYDTPLRLAVIRLLEQAYGGTLDAYYTQVADGPLARLHVIIRTPAGSRVQADEADLLFGHVNLEVELVEIDDVKDRRAGGDHLAGVAQAR
jgi:NAD-specific glutamate dehydrogenase